MRTDEITDASERLPLPMRNQFEYELSLDDGELYFQGQRLGEVFETGVAVAEKLTASQPRFLTELIRRRLELQEYHDMQKLALSSEEQPDLLVVLSPIPDVVVSGAVDLGAYDKKRMKTMLRVFRRTETGIEATSVSLDLSDREGIQAVGARFGIDIPLTASSEEVLEMRLWGHSLEFGDDYVSYIARLYDGVLEKRYGGVWSGGRQGEHMLDAQGYIKAQQDLLDDHMARLRMIRKAGASENELKQARYDFAAALARRLRGDCDAATLEAAGEAARANNEVYANDCPDGVSLSATESLERLGLANREWKHGSCRNCNDVYNPNKIVGECDVCKYCEQADNAGKMQEVHKKAQQIQKALKKDERAPDMLPAELFETKKTNFRGQNIQASFGEKAILKTIYSFGGADKIVFNRETGEAIAKL